MTLRTVTAGAAALLAALAVVTTGGSAAAAQTSAAGRSYTAAQVAQHASASDCWTILGRSVYNLTSFVQQHPGGSSRIIAICGRNGTAAFNGQHGSNSQVKAMLKRYRIGALKT